MSEGFHVCNRSRRNCPSLVMSPDPKQLDAVSEFKSLVERISQIRSEIGTLDVIISSGDLSDDKTVNSYKLLKI